MTPRGIWFHVTNCTTYQTNIANMNQSIDVFLRESPRHSHEWKEANSGNGGGGSGNASTTSAYTTLPAGALLAPLITGGHQSNGSNGMNGNHDHHYKDTLSPELAALSAASMYSGMAAECQNLRDRVGQSSTYSIVYTSLSHLSYHDLLV
jgi:hypothetical protein